MIGFLRGELVSKQPPMLLLDVNGVGYQVEAPMSSFYVLGEVGSQVKILTYMHVREDAILLYGFATEQERSLFEELIKVSGIGAKMAMAILSNQATDEFANNIFTENLVSLTKIPGVGKKTAERLVLEMRDRLKKWKFAAELTGVAATEVSPQPDLVGTAVESSAIEAMVSLGYKEDLAVKMVKAAYSDGISLENLIKAALQQVKLR